MASRTVTPPRLPVVGGVQSLKGALKPAFKCLWGGFWVPITSQAGALPPVCPLYSPCIPHVFNTRATGLALAWRRLCPGSHRQRGVPCHVQVFSAVGSHHSVPKWLRSNKLQAGSPKSASPGFLWPVRRRQPGQRALSHDL